jgi:galactose oxidase
VLWRGVSQIWSWPYLNLLEHIMQSAMSRVQLTCAVLLVLSLMACGKGTVTPEKVGGVDLGGTPVEGRPEIPTPDPPKPDPPKPQPPIVSSEPKGKWSAVLEFPIVPISAALMPNGKVVTFSSWDRFAFSGDTAQRNRTFTATFDPGDDSVSEWLVTETKHDMFCPGTALLSDGRLMVNGGGPYIATTSLYSSADNTWTNTGSMNRKRWYNSSITLPDGNVFTLGGITASGGDPKTIVEAGELWNGSGWRMLAGAQTQPLFDGVNTTHLSRAEQHPRMFVAPNGKLFVAGPTPNMLWYDTTGIGSSRVAGRRGDDAYATNNVTVMLEAGKILSAGGNPNYNQDGALQSPSSANAYVTDINNAVTTRKVAPMKSGRTFANGVVLPDGQVLVVGGVNHGKGFDDSGAIMTPELFDPKLETWTTMAVMRVPRTYHSIALLLPDGRVMAGGGGLCGDCTVNHPNVELFSPAYLFKGARPKLELVPGGVRYGAAFLVKASDEITQFSLIRNSSVTHSTNTDQRLLKLEFKRDVAEQFTVKSPANANLAPPGYYMLFGLNANDVPSMAKILRVF